MDRTFEGALLEWRGPAPFFFVVVPEDVCDDLAVLAASVSYGWGMVPARVTIGSSTWQTSLCPRDGGYLVPVRRLFRLAEGLEVDDLVRVRVEVGVPAREECPVRD